MLKNLGRRALAVFAGNVCLFFALPALSVSVVSFKDGSQTTTDDLLGQKKALIYIEKDCAACLSYAKDLKDCPEQLKSQVVLISVSTVVETKALARRMPAELPLYVLKNRRPDLKATPTTQTLGEQRVGKLSCAQLAQQLQSEN